jgi:hypothetical protein
MITKTEWTTLQKEWFGCKYAAMEPVDAVRARCSDDADRINALEKALRSVLDWAPVPPDHWRAENQDAFMSDMMKAREVLNA